jgi:serine/threonine protein phosphatase PrpC
VLASDGLWDEISRKQAATLATTAQEEAYKENVQPTKSICLA